MRMKFVVIEYFTDKEKYSMIKIMYTFVGLQHLNYIEN